MKRNKCRKQKVAQWWNSLSVKPITCSSVVSSRNTRGGLITVRRTQSTSYISTMVNSSSARHLCVEVTRYANGAGNSLRIHRGAQSVTYAATCGSLATGRIRRKARLSSPFLWFRDRRRPQLNLSASVRITIASFAQRKDGDLSRVVGLSSSHGVTF